MWWKVWISVLVTGYVALCVNWDGAGWHETHLVLLGMNATVLVDEACLAVVRSLRKWGIIS